MKKSLEPGVLAKQAVDQIRALLPGDVQVAVTIWPDEVHAAPVTVFYANPTCLSVMAGHLCEAGTEQPRPDHCAGCQGAWDRAKAAALVLAREGGRC